MATVVAVAVGISAVEVSPVAPPAATLAMQAPTVAPDVTTNDAPPLPGAGTRTRTTGRRGAAGRNGGPDGRRVALARQAEIIWLVGPSSEPANQLTGGNLRRLVPDVADRDVYLCASPGLSAAVRTGLRDAGLPAHRLHEEVFGC